MKIDVKTQLSVLSLALVSLLAPKLAAQEVLPFPPAPSGSTAGLTMQDSTYKKRVEPKRLAAGAPNILIILMDDLGPGTASTYGGEINTPTLDRVAKMGISYNRFHSTAMCSPTRAALLCGRNHTRVGNGQIAAIANDFDGFSGTIPKSSATVAEVLKNYGYNTGAWGKWHNTPEEQITSKGPFDYWPTGYGFEYFYGFLAGEASQYEPTLTRNTTQVTEELPKGYHLTDDIAMDAIKWLREQKAFAPDKPFDFIVSSQFTHHLTDDEIVRFIRWMDANARRGWFIADLRRHPFPFYGFPLLARLANWHRFVRHDGQISIGRSFVPADWHRLLGRAEVPATEVVVQAHVPFRLTVARCIGRQRCNPP